MKKFVAMGLDVVVQAGAGLAASCTDAAYEAAGAKIAATAADTVGNADFVLRVTAPTADEAALIKQGAKLVETAQDVLEELAPQRPALRASAPPPRAPRSDPLLDALGFDPVSLDVLAARTGLPTPALQARLLELELQGEVQRLAGGLFQRIASA